MKKLLLFTILLGALNIYAQSPEKNKYTILLTGASFASSNNGWFELACKKLDATPINKAIAGEAIANTANKMAADTLYTRQQLEDIDAFVIMHVHDKDVASENGLKENYKDYRTPFDRSNYAAAYDYVIKHYITDCYNLKFDKNNSIKQNIKVALIKNYKNRLVLSLHKRYYKFQNRDLKNLFCRL